MDCAAVVVCDFVRSVFTFDPVECYRARIFLVELQFCLVIPVQPLLRFLWKPVLEKNS